MTRPIVFITGATGFVGRRLVALLDPARFDLRCLTRDPRAGFPAGVRAVVGALDRPADYESALQGASLVVHLAAQTGKAPRDVHFAANRDATARLVEASRAAGASGFVFVSSIAAAFADRFAYPYADAKAAAEEIVRTSGLPFLIVRPTMILGSGSPVGAGLARMALGPFVVVFGGGQVRVQPVSVDDVAHTLAAVVESGKLPSDTLELGGPEVVTMEELLQRMRSSAGRPPARTLHLPLAPTRRILAALEPWLLSVMPLTAGQLASFANDGIARPGAPCPPSRTALATMLTPPRHD